MPADILFTSAQLSANGLRVNDGPTLTITQSRGRGGVRLAFLAGRGKSDRLGGVARYVFTTEPLTGLLCSGTVGGAVLAVLYYGYMLPYRIKTRVFHCPRKVM